MDGAPLTGTEPGPGAGPGLHPGFRRSVAAFARLRVAVRPVLDADAPEPTLPAAHPTYRAITGAIRAAPADTAALLQDASLLDRASYELGLFAPLLRAAFAGQLSSAPADASPAGAAFTTAASVRLARTRWNWEAFLADPTLELPSESASAWVLHLPSAGPLQVRRLHALPALLLEACAYPLTRAGAVAAVMEHVEGDAGQLASLVHAQIDELLAAGLLQHDAPTAADHTVDQMLRELRSDDPPHPARSIVGLLARAARATRKHADAATAVDAAYPVYAMDRSVSGIEQLLMRAGLRAAFRAELDGYWASEDGSARVKFITPLLDTLRRALGEGMHALAPYVHT